MKAISVLVLLSMVMLALGKKRKEALNRNTVPFWLQDITDGMCLGPDGFGPCDVGSIWIFAQTHPTKTDRAVVVSMLAPEPDRMCMSSLSAGMFSPRQRLGVSKCARKGAHKFGLVDATTKGHRAGYLLTQGAKDCMSRGQGRLRNSADIQLCTRGSPLAVVETPIHTSGMQIATLDGYCFDGSRFRLCDDENTALRWGIGLNFDKPEPSRNIFAFFDQENCLVREGEGVKKADCRSNGAKKWGWQAGRLSQGNTHCLGRRQDDTAILVPCVEGFEYVTFITPNVSPSSSRKSKTTGGSSGYSRGSSSVSGTM